MSKSTSRWLRAAAAVPATALVALAMAAPASAQSTADTVAPSAPQGVTSTYLSDRIVTQVNWGASTDNLTAAEDLTYIVESDDIYSPRVVVKGGTQALITYSFSVTVWCVDAAGNASQKVTVRTNTV